MKIQTIGVALVVVGVAAMMVLTTASLFIDDPQALLAGTGVWGTVITAGAALAIRNGRNGAGQR